MKNKFFVEKTKGLSLFHFDTWHDYTRWVTEEMSEYDNYIWRGQKDSKWELIPSIDRSSKSKGFTELDHIETFKRSTMGRRGTNPKEMSILQWWALGQHYGLLTPLLDWTLSPYIALFFAFEKEAKNISERAIYGIDREWFISLLGKINRSQRRDVDGYAVFIPDSDENNRMIVQSGLFSYTELGKSIEQIIADNHDTISKDQHPFIKCHIENIHRENCLQVLNRMNINHSTLFPDLIGSAMYANIKLEISNY